MMNIFNDCKIPVSFLLEQILQISSYGSSERINLGSHFHERRKFGKNFPFFTILRLLISATMATIATRTIMITKKYNLLNILNFHSNPVGLNKPQI